MLGGEVFWIEGEPRAWLAIMIRPRPDNLLEEDLRRCADCGIDTVVSLLEPREAAWLGLSREETMACQIGMEFVKYPISDQCVPIDIAGFRTFVLGLADLLRAGHSIGVHCQGSIGRSTVTAACALIHLGWTPEAAIDAIGKARGCPVPDTREQYEWILNYKAEA